MLLKRVYCCFDFQKMLTAIGTTSNLAHFVTTRTKPECSNMMRTTEAEIRWVWNVAEFSKTLHSEDKSPELFRAMFPDSKIAEGFKCGRNKTAYLLKFALGPFVKGAISDDVGNNYFSVSFDESDGNMAVVIRYFKEGSVVVELLDVVDLEGCFDADNCVKAVISAVDDAGLQYKNWIGDASDKCNTMRGKYLVLVLFELV